MLGRVDELCSFNSNSVQLTSCSESVACSVYITKVWKCLFQNWAWEVHFWHGKEHIYLRRVLISEWTTLKREIDLVHELMVHFIRTTSIQLKSVIPERNINWGYLANRTTKQQNRPVNRNNFFIKLFCTRDCKSEHLYLWTEDDKNSQNYLRFVFVLTQEGPCRTLEKPVGNTWTKSRYFNVLYSFFPFRLYNSRNMGL